MKALAYTGLVGGLAALALLVAWQGFATVAGAIDFLDGLGEYEPDNDELEAVRI